MTLFYVKKRTLLLIAGIVWMIAGFNVARLGIISYGNIEKSFIPYLLSLLIFILFGMMFYKMRNKHVRRIKGLPDLNPFWKFFDLKAYLIMAFMMGGGIGFRAAGIFPQLFIAFFYTGLGLALFLAGVLFFISFISYHE